MKAGDVAAMPGDIRHQGYSPKRSMLLVWENASPELPELIASGRAPTVPGRLLRRPARAAEITSLRDAVASHVHDGDTVAMEGFTHLIPHAAGHEVIRQGRRDLTLVRMTPDVVYDQLIGAGCATKLIFSWGGNPGVGSLHRFRDAVEHGWPQPLDDRGAQPRRHGRPLRRRAPRACRSACSAATSAPTSSHHTAIDRADHVPVHGRDAHRGAGARPRRRRHPRPAGRPRGATCSSGDSSACRRRRCSRRSASIVTVEEIVDELEPRPNAVVLPRWVVDAVCEVPGGAHPSFAMGYSTRDNAFYRAWDDDRAATGDVHGLDRRARPRHRRLRRVPAQPRASSRSWPCLSSQRRRRDDRQRGACAQRRARVCFVGIGLPSTAANLARRLHAPDCVLDLRVAAASARSRPGCRCPSATASWPRPPTRSSACPRSSPTGCRPAASTSASSAPRSSTASATSTRR